MNKVTIDLRNILTPRGAQAYIHYRMDFPAYYGRNLDALADMLGEIAQETLITVVRPVRFSAEMEAYWPRLVRVLDDAQADNPHVKAVCDIA